MGEKVKIREWIGVRRLEVEINKFTAECIGIPDGEADRFVTHVVSGDTTQLMDHALRILSWMILGDLPDEVPVGKDDDHARNSGEDKCGVECYER